MKIALAVFVTLAVIAIVQVQAAPLAEDSDALASYGADLVDVYCGPKDGDASDGASADASTNPKSKSSKEGKKKSGKKGGKGKGKKDEGSETE